MKNKKIILASFMVLCMLLNVEYLNIKQTQMGHLK